MLERLGNVVRGNEDDQACQEGGRVPAGDAVHQGKHRQTGEDKTTQHHDVVGDDLAAEFGQERSGPDEDWGEWKCSVNWFTGGEPERIERAERIARGGKD